MRQSIVRFSTVLRLRRDCGWSERSHQAPGPGSAARANGRDAGRWSRGQATYEGSDHYIASPVPFVNVIWRDTISLGVDGLSAYWRYENLRVGAA